jgi:hypothetical protein
MYILAEPRDESKTAAGNVRSGIQTALQWLIKVVAERCIGMGVRMLGNKDMCYLPLPT